MIRSVLFRSAVGEANANRVQVCLLLFLTQLLMSSTTVWAIDSEGLSDPALQSRYVAISKELRCLVCQNQSIQDSNAELAKDLRRQVRGMLESGRSDDEIYAYMVERYGDYVRYRPPWRLNTLLLQLMPILIALLAVWMLVGTLRKHRAHSPSTDAEPASEAHNDPHSEGSNAP